MKFHIFGIWERVAKPIIYLLIFVLTIVLIYLFFAIEHNNDNPIYTTFVFAAPVVYALLLFLANILLEKEKHRVEEKLYEREGFFLTLSRLRNVTNATINKMVENDLSDIESKVLMFQIMTGRDAETIKAISQGNKNPHIYIRENGFVYTSKMMLLETAALNYIKENQNTSSKSEAKPIRKLLKYYEHSSKKLENSFIKLKMTYGGNLQHLVDYDNFVSNFDFKTDDIISKIEDIQSQLGDSNLSTKEIDEKIDTLRVMINKLCQQFQDAFDNIEDAISSILTACEATKHEANHE